MRRRDLLKHMTLAPLFLRASQMKGQSLLQADAAVAGCSAPPSMAASRFVPHYPARSPLEDLLRLVTPGLDEYPAELHAYEIEQVLARWRESLKSNQWAALQASLDPAVRGTSLTAFKDVLLRDRHGIRSYRRSFSDQEVSGADRLLREFRAWIGEGTAVEDATFEIPRIEVLRADPLGIRTTVRYSLVVRMDASKREQRVGTWLIEWRRKASENQASPWRIMRLLPQGETRVALLGPGFMDVTEQALGHNTSWSAQLGRGADHWRTVLDVACGIDVYGNNGVAAGDYDNDGRDDLYVSQPAGLPNRLYRNRGDGTLEDVTERAGVGVLDNTACALFADLRNSGLQDLLVVCGSGPLLLLNNGDGTFTRKPDAFRFAKPPQGTFTHAAIADYDRDGRLDIYFCLYSYYLGLDQYHYPTPYFDARNGPPNFLMGNQGDGTFLDRTEAAGLNAENDRYSFACAWGESGGNTAPDLYVVNDFGRNNLYRSRGDGTFHPVSTEAHVEDVGAGMSAAWADVNNDGRPDLYVANMWSAAGQRVSQQAQFHPHTPERQSELYRRHASGNALYRNRGDGTFENVAVQAGADVGRWAWCSDLWDFDQDGHQDLYIANGYITAPQTACADANAAKPAIDLGSFFWRQVVGKSPDDATPSLAYERGWNALNELIRGDRSWSGHERNVLLANNGDGSFCEISGPVGMDFLDDARSFALADLDGDGRPEVIVKNRTAPQLRILRNAMEDIGDSVILRLRGTKSNRDAIGAAVTLASGDLRQTRYVVAGSGFLAQHTKELHFGLGRGGGEAQATVRWPSGVTQEFKGIPRNHRVDLVEGDALFHAKPFLPIAPAYTPAKAALGRQEEMPTAVETWLLDPLRAPAFTLPDLAGTAHSLEASRGRATALCFWSLAAPGQDQIARLAKEAARLVQRINVIAINVDGPEHAGDVRRAAQQSRLSCPVLLATGEILGVYNIIVRYLFDRRADMVVPSTFLLDREGMIVKLYQGSTTAGDVLRDAQAIPLTVAERMQKGLPFPGTLHQGEFQRNDFTYGVAMFQHGYLDQAAESFQQVIARRPDDAEAHYNLGTLELRRNNFARSREYLQRTLSLKPDYPEAWNNLGMMAAQEGRDDEAIRSFQKSLSLRPAYPTALLNLGNVYRHQQALPEAQDYLARALALQPDDPEANYSLGMLKAQGGEAVSAAEYLQRAVALRPDYPEALNNLGVLYVQQHDYAKAEQQFQTCMRLSPEFEQSYANLARLYLLQQDRPKAREALQRLLRLRPESAMAKQGLSALDAAP